MGSASIRAAKALSAPRSAKSTAWPVNRRPRRADLRAHLAAVGLHLRGRPDDVGPGFGQRERHARADPPPRPGHERGLARQVEEVHAVSSTRIRVFMAVAFPSSASKACWTDASGCRSVMSRSTGSPSAIISMARS